MQKNDDFNGLIHLKMPETLWNGIPGRGGIMFRGELFSSHGSLIRQKNSVNCLLDACQNLVVDEEPSVLGRLAIGLSADGLFVAGLFSYGRFVYIRIEHVSLLGSLSKDMMELRVVCAGIKILSSSDSSNEKN